MRRPGALLPGLALALLPLGCGGAESRSAIPVVTVKQQRFARNVDADGYLRPVVSVPVTVPSDVPWGLRIIWIAPSGSVVKKGDPVVRFDDLEPRSRLADA